MDDFKNITIQSTLAWYHTQPLKDFERGGMCQCGSEKIIARSYDSQRMRASLLTMVFIDQFVYTHYRNIYLKFRQSLSLPKLCHHIGPGLASPDWFVDSGHGYANKADWRLIAVMFGACILDLRRWLEAELVGPPAEFDEKLEQEVESVFRRHAKRILKTGLALANAPNKFQTN